MPKIAEDTFQLNGVTIQTETPVTIRVYDAREYNGSSYEVCKILYIDDIELAVAYTYGQVKFIYGNDGSIKVVT